MYVVLLGLLCGIAAAVIILLVVCLCHRCGLLDSCIRSTKPDSDYPIIGFPSPDALSGRTEYVQPSFTDDGDLDPRPGRRAPPPVAEIPGSAVDAAVLRERLARLAYDSGDESPMPLGQLDFSVGYDSDAMALAGVVMGATQLPIVRGRAPTTFVHVTLLPGQHYRYKTSTKREETNPRFDEAFRFGVVDLDELIGSGLLQFRLYHSDWLRKEELIGWYDVNLGDYGKARLCSGVRESCPLNSPAILVNNELHQLLLLPYSFSSVRCRPCPVSLPIVRLLCLVEVLLIRRASSGKRPRCCDDNSASFPSRSRSIRIITATER